MVAFVSVVFFCLVATEAHAISVLAGDQLVSTVEPNVRFRNLDGGADSQQLYVGQGDLGVQANRSQAFFDFDSSNTFEISYDSSTGMLSSSLMNSGDNASTSFNVGTNAFLGADALLLELRNQSGGDQIEITNFAFNSTSISGVFVASSGQRPYFTIQGLDLNQDFDLSGTLNLSGSFGGSNEAGRVSFQFGTVVPEPSSIVLVLVGGVSAVFYRRRSAKAMG